MKFNLKTMTLAVAAGLSGLAHAQTEALLFNNQLELNGLDSQSGYELRLRLPEGQLKTLYLAPSESITFNATDFALNQFSDGIYKYELSPLANQLNKSRDKASQSQPAAQSISGSFTVVNGSSIVDRDEDFRDQQILDDLIVDGSICVGLDCVNGESFGFDTIRLKENNLRIRFFDTSNSASFPSNDWEITVNDSSNGGANKFSITDIDSGRIPFTIEAGARANALYVDDGGRVGVGTSTPVVETHIVDGDSPTVRLEQNGSNGWSPQTWDMAGNETNFFIRDVTHSSKLPFRIRPDAPSNSIFINNNGNVGLGDDSPDGALDIANGDVVIPNGRIAIGTETPTNKLHIVNTINAGITLENSDTSTAWKFVNKTNLFSITKVGTSSSEFQVFDDGRMIIGSGGATPNFDMDASGNVTIQGTLSQNSDVHSKENIELINSTDVLDKVMSLPISMWNYKFDDDSIKHLGPMAQDFFKAFNLGHTEDKISTIDTSGVALASIQALGQKMMEKEEKIQSLESSNQELKDRINKLEALINEKLQ